MTEVARPFYRACLWLLLPRRLTVGCSRNRHYRNCAYIGTTRRASNRHAQANPTSINKVTPS
jgi:hypothetical protein